jgi:hypothetical protein
MMLFVIAFVFCFTISMIFFLKIRIKLHLYLQKMEEKARCSRQIIMNEENMERSAINEAEGRSDAAPLPARIVECQFSSMMPPMVRLWAR